jgi:aminoglycoside phosphotransferase (APT) family kinase protein
MLTPPADLPESVLRPALERNWGIRAASVQYRAVGWGSHHWAVTGEAGSRWFVTADELENKRVSQSEPLTEGFRRLRAALSAAMGLRECGRTFVVAPVPGRDGEPLAQVSRRFGVAVYPFVQGQSFEWAGFSSPAHRRAVLDLLAATHTAPPEVRERAVADDFRVPHRDALEAAWEPGSDASDRGPYGRPATRLVQQYALPLQRLLARYDHLVTAARTQPARTVLTHGEPHPGNTMLTVDGWVLIDWDTALAAPPERDLWSLDPGDGSVLEAYAGLTGVTPHTLMLDLYRLRWDIADIAVDVSRFRRPHTGSEEDDESFELLSSLVRRASGEGSDDR